MIAASQKVKNEEVETIVMFDRNYASLREFELLGYKRTCFIHAYDLVTVTDDETKQIEDYLIPIESLDICVIPPYPLKKPKAFNTYFIVNESKTLVKIGKATDVERRLKEISTISPESLTIILVINKDIEFQLHGEFEMYRKNGEWFEFSEEIKDYISQHKLTVN